MRLLLHVGHGKTGSSFLQSWLAANAEVLAQNHQLLYSLRCPLLGAEDRLAARGQFTLGNGFVLNPMLEPGVSRRRQHRWWRRLLRQQPCADRPFKGVVFSHEPWTRHLPDRLPQLLDLIATLGLDGADLWLLVRDPLEHAISVYGQMVKRHGFTGSLEQWLDIYDFPDVLQRFLQAVAHQPQGLRLRVQHYGRLKQRLPAALQHWLGLDPAWPWQAPPRRAVNRSLSADELQLMRWLNAWDPLRAAQVGEQLVNRLPDTPSAQLRPSPEVERRFQARWQPVVDRLNQQLPQEAQLQLAAADTRASADLPEAEADQALIALGQAQLHCLLEAWAEDGRPRR